MAGRSSTPRRGETSPSNRRGEHPPGQKKPVEKQTNQALPILVGGGAVLLLMIVIFATRSGKSKPPEPEETARVQRPAPPPVQQDPFAELRAGFESASVPVAQSFLEKLSAKDASGVRALLEFPRFHENEARRLEAEGKAYEAWATLSAERQQEYKDGLVKRLLPSESSLKSWRLDTMVLDDHRPETKFLDGDDSIPATERYRRLEVLFKMRPADWTPAKGKKLSLPVYVGLYRTGSEWSVEDVAIEVRLSGANTRLHAPNPASAAYQKLLANAPGGGQKVDLTGNIEDQLEGGPRRVRLEDGTVGLAAKPAPVAYLESTTPETRTKVEQLMATMLDPAQTTGWAAARDELLMLKRDSMPAALTQLARIYKSAVEEAKSTDPLDDQELDKLQKVTQLLMKMREEVYQQDYDDKIGFSRMEYASNEGDRMRKDINKVAMFWFGWWHENKDVIPQGEPMTTLRRPRNR